MQSALDNIEEMFWSRHSNPRSGWSRVPTGPVLIYAVYRRDRRLFLAGVLWVTINPFLFAPPETDDAWMTRGVLAERWWVREEGNGTIDSPTRTFVIRLAHWRSFTLLSPRGGDNQPGPPWPRW